MSPARPLLRQAALPVRLGLAAVVLVLAGGYLASLVYIRQHHGPKDEDPALTLLDLEALYHGVRREAPLRRAVAGAHGREFLPVPGERERLLAWLDSEDPYQGYDPLDAGETPTPAEILEERCLRCHARGASEGGGIGDELPLEDWRDVSRVAFAKELEPVPLDILVVSTHAHAQTMPLLALAAGALLLLTGWAAWLRHGLCALMGLGLLADLGGMWLARLSMAGVQVMLIGGAAFGVAYALALLLVLAEVLGPGRRPPPGQAGGTRARAPG